MTESVSGEESPAFLVESHNNCHFHLSLNALKLAFGIQQPDDEVFPPYAAMQFCEFFTITADNPSLFDRLRDFLEEVETELKEKQKQWEADK